MRSRVRPNNDDIDIDGCEQVRISDCDISCGDDAIVLKSTSGHTCRNVADYQLPIEHGLQCFEDRDGNQRFLCEYHY